MGAVHHLVLALFRRTIAAGIKAFWYRGTGRMSPDVHAAAVSSRELIETYISMPAHMTFGVGW